MTLIAETATSSLPDVATPPAPDHGYKGSFKPPAYIAAADLGVAEEVQRILGLSQIENVNTYMNRYPELRKARLEKKGSEHRYVLSMVIDWQRAREARWGTGTD